MCGECCKGNREKKDNEIKVSYETIMKLPKDTQRAFILFSVWFVFQENPEKDQMSSEVYAAYEKIKKTKIPDGSGLTMENSYYMQYVEHRFWED